MLEVEKEIDDLSIQVEKLAEIEKIIDNNDMYEIIEKMRETINHAYEACSEIEDKLYDVIETCKKLRNE